MKPLSERLFFPAVEDAQCSFGGNVIFVAQIKGTKSAYHNLEVDLLPSYSHDPSAVQREIIHAEERYPLPWAPHYWSLPLEFDDGTNGLAFTMHEWGQGDRTIYHYGNAYCAKTIPIHPAMTRYIVSHEYGHAACYQAARLLFKQKGSDDTQEFEKDYAKRRGLEHYSGYGRKRWHLATGEIIANDFRILMLGKEAEFWPHDCEHPLKKPEMTRYWEEIQVVFQNEIKGQEAFEVAKAKQVAAAPSLGAK